MNKLHTFLSQALIGCVLVFGCYLMVSANACNDQQGLLCSTNFQLAPGGLTMVGGHSESTGYQITARVFSVPIYVPPPPSQPPPPPGEDSYEADNDCNSSRLISSDETIQRRNIHKAGDVDWVRIDAVAGATYRINVDTPADSKADVILETHRNCTLGADQVFAKSHTLGARLEVKAPTNGPFYLRINHNIAAEGGTQYNYVLSVRKLQVENTKPSAAIIVAGRLNASDSLQENIHKVSQDVYKLLKSKGYTDDIIYYLAHEPKLAGFDAQASKGNLEFAITTWAKSALKSGGALTLYMVDHGRPDQFYININDEFVTPKDLDDWMTKLENELSDIKVIVVIEACQAGSFIGQPNRISKPNRLIVTSTSERDYAYTSKEGAYFSDQFISRLQAGDNFATAFDHAQDAAIRGHRDQNALLDANGDGIPNDTADKDAAKEFAFDGNGVLNIEIWVPEIFSVTAPSNLPGSSGSIRVEVRDDGEIAKVWGVVYPPGYAPPREEVVNGEALQTIPFSTVTDAGSSESAKFYVGDLSTLNQSGTYRIVVYAEDSSGLQSRPMAVEVTVGTPPGTTVFLPLISR